MHNQKLLGNYRPELRFSIGENFFPMDVTKFIGSSKLIDIGDSQKTDLWKKKSQEYFNLSPEEYAKKKNDPNLSQKKSELLGEVGTSLNYLQFVDQPWWERVQWWPLIILIISISAIIFGLQENQIPVFLPFFSSWDFVKLIITIIPLGVWCFWGGKININLAMSINIFAVLFYAHQLGIAAGYVATSLLTFLSINAILKTLTKNVAYIAIGGLLITLFINALFIIFTFPYLMDMSLITRLGLFVLVITLLPPILLTASSSFDIFIKKQDARHVRTIIYIKEKVTPKVTAVIKYTLVLITIVLFLDLIFFQTSTIETRTLKSLILCSSSGLLILLYFIPLQVNIFEVIETRIRSHRIPGTILLGIVIWWLGSFIVSFGAYNFVSMQGFIFYPALYILTIIINLVITLGLVGGDAISWFMDIKSPQSDSATDIAIKKYQECKNGKPYVYARILSDNSWAVLQYHYFYAFNDYRKTAHGINNHEGDWEMVAVFLKNETNAKDIEDYVPFGVACSQHENGELRFWNSVEHPNTRPIINVALGSHANYFESRDIYETSYQFSGITRRIVSIFDSILKWFHGGEEGSGLPPEKVNGKYEDNDKLNKNWNIVDISETEPKWIKYRGLWGQKTNHPNESGPTGPKWVRLEDIQEGRKRCYEMENDVRLRWGLHCWKDILLLEMTTSVDKPLYDRKRALKILTEG